MFWKIIQMKYVSSILALFSIFSFTPFIFSEHTILGTNSVFTSGKYEIISDIKVSNLQIRQVRQIDSKLCSDKSQHDDHIEMSGPINPDTPYIIERLINKIKESPNRCKDERGIGWAIKVFLNSGGGYMEDGYELGEIFRRNYVYTQIAYNGECYSSCATAFLGGYYRDMGKESKLMFHAPYSYTSRYDISCSDNDSKLLSYMKTMVGNDNGDFLYKRTMSYCSESSGWSLNKDAAELFGLIDQD